MTRETWGSVKEVAGKRIQVNFLMGKPLPPEPKAKKVMLSDGEYSTEMRFIICTWFGEISSCSCLTVLPGPAWVLLNKICEE